MSGLTLENFAAMNVQYRHYTFDYFLDSMEKCGLKNIELWAAVPQYCRLDYNTGGKALKKIREMRKKIEDKGMKVVIYTPETLAYPYNFAVPDENVRSRTIDFFEMSMDDALEFGTDRVFINTGCGYRDMPREESWAISVDTLSQICKRAEKKGVTLDMEQLQPFESNLVLTCKDMARVQNEVNSSALRTCIDLVAMEVMGDAIEDFYSVIPEKIDHIHYADGCPGGHYILGDGNLPLEEQLKSLENCNYDRYISLEINRAEYWEDPHTSLKRSVDYLKSFIPEK
jgi:fructoselysine 3-epimerase